MPPTSCGSTALVSALESTVLRMPPANAVGARMMSNTITEGANALLEGRDFVIPDDVKAVARPVLRHRIQLSADAEIEGQTSEMLLDKLLNQVAAPRQ